MGTVSGTVHVRPLRAALVAAEFDASTIRRATDLACSAWGGLHFPMLSASDPDVSRKVERLSVDFLHPVDESDAAALAIARRDGLRWQSGSPYGPFDPPEAGLRMRLLPSEEVTVESGRKVALPTWSPDDPLADLFHVWFGQHQHGSACESALQPYCTEATVIDATTPEALQELLDYVVPVTATGSELTYTGLHSGAAVVVIGDSPEDLRTFWNLRATGTTVFPWPQTGRGGLFDEVLSAWLSRPSTRENASTWRSGDGTREGKSVAIVGREQDGSSPLAEIIEQHGFTPWRHDSDPMELADSWTGFHPLQTDHEHSFSVQVDRDDWQLVVPVPSMIQRRRDTYAVGQVAAHIDVSTEQRLPPGRTVLVPGSRRLAPLVSELAREHHQVVRATGDGVVMSVQATAERVEVPLVPTLAIFERIFPDVTVATSDEGRFATQLLERLGGPDSATTCEPAVRAVLDRVARSGQGLPIAELISRAETARGAWPGIFSRISSRDYAERVVYRLLSAEILQAVVQVRCPHCSTESQLSPRDLASKVHCPLCAQEFPLGLALGLQRAKDSWRYALAGSIPSARMRAGLPMMATLAVLKTAHRAGYASATHAFGLTLQGAGWRCEIDVAVLIADGPTTVALLMEVKGGTDLVNDADVQNLLRARALLRDAGIDALIGMATTRDRLNDEEVALFRGVADAAPMRRYRSSSALALPIVLTASDLSLPWSDPGHPWHWAEVGAPPLEGLSTKGCARNLGFVGYVHAVDGLRCRWSDESAPPGGRSSDEAL